MKNKEQLAQEYWQAQQDDKAAAKMRRQIELLEREELNRPEYTIGIVNDEGQLEVVQAKPLSPTVKLLPEVLSFVLFFVGTFSLIEILL